MQLPIIVIKKGKERALNNRHPWLYSGAVARMPKLQDGDMAEIKDEDGNRMGYGFYAPGTQLICRIFEFTAAEMPVHTPAYWHEKLRKAWELRSALQIANDRTNAYRLVHAEGDFFPGLIADVYGSTVVVQLLVQGTMRIRQWLVEGLQALGFQHIYDKSKSWKEVEWAQGWLTAPGPKQIEVLENGVKFVIDVAEGQKTGFFLDQRDNRALLGTYSKGKKVLNTFSYSGGFSMYALREGATAVHSVDSSQKAVDLCDVNVKANGFDAQRHEGICADVFECLKQLKQDEYDVIILDPPAFAKNAKALPQASRAYKELNLKAFKKIKPGGIVFTFSCSQKIAPDLFRKIVFAAAADAQRNVRILHQLTQPADHPINIFHPEGEYLKGLVLQVE